MENNQEWHSWKVMSDEKFAGTVREYLREVGFFALFNSEKNAYNFCTDFFRIIGVRSSDVRITKVHEIE